MALATGLLMYGLTKYMMQALNCMSLGNISAIDRPSQAGGPRSLLLVETMEAQLAQVEGVPVKDIGV
jgi:hypothetical protein